MKTFYPKDLAVPDFHALLQGSIAPRPIAFVSTIDQEGNVNLSPFSFFNLFSTNPPILVFSPSRRVRDNTTKHTLENVKEVPEVVIHVVHYGMVEQMSLASTEYAKGVNEFEKAGFTAVPSQEVAPPRVKEAKVAFECKVNEVKPLGETGGAGNLVICEVLVAHVDEHILDEKGVIDPYKIDLVARMGGNWYSRSNGEALFEIPKPLRTLGIGIDQIPEEIRNSTVLTGNNLGRLGNVESLPTKEELELFGAGREIQEMRIRFQNDQASWLDHLHQFAKEALEEGEVEKAWKILLQEK
ncbi:flavin reductase family protein [Algoriphagus zhangzhouensis]|uniref:NADH-FMN oxidoreductase RutF, flavin reductase (DIM6/NTAB) family n=1 Tax=Algoriphagus zhangzhouensis TaxID=1073327 RepID=A0A1M7ZEU1_9BACT|nr:flavin reductase family protein [Algoriphagus zhangzhouensis]TDY46137.1 flavin reductase (DIM6/NTAB) family NADH-FMN oxidoreductase RutF [Algoriphagus zhangzhouensis]SHO63425.1 NADH-FMN oxidoreductase RutF, flavin reductase (DIM6/NTAB) family [Algoriphagus zhangzhouensis]